MRRLLLLLCLLCPLVAFCAEGFPPGLESACVYVRADAGATFLGFGGSNTGTGFPVSSDLVVTCDHLTRVPTIYGTTPSRRLLVEVEPGRLVGAVVVQRDADHDLALLRICEPFPGKPVTVGEFRLNRGDEVFVVGSFPDSVRVVRGAVISNTVLDGCAMATAKVRTGFSGGPVIGPDGTVQGMLSQRDDHHNAIFVRSEAILALLKAYERRTGCEVLAPMRRAARIRTAVVPPDSAAPAPGDIFSGTPVAPHTVETTRHAIGAPAIRSAPPAVPGALLAAPGVHPAAPGVHPNDLIIARTADGSAALRTDAPARPAPRTPDTPKSDASPTPKPVQDFTDTLLAIPVRKPCARAKTLLASPLCANADN